MEMHSYRTRSRMSFPKLMAVIIASAAALLVIALVVAYLCGVRYITSETGDGLKVRFFGIVDSEGRPTSGRLSYSDGRSAKVESDGSIVYSSGDVYTGELEGMLKHGEGKLVSENGDVYTGEFYYDVIHGTGVLSAMGNSYEGSFVNGKFDGAGKYTASNGDVYEGAFKDGKRHGSGTMTYANGDSYTGAYVKDVREGYGTYTWSNGEKYTGEWKDNYMNGEGTFTWPSGRVYTGHFENGVIVRTDETVDGDVTDETNPAPQV